MNTQIKFTGINRNLNSTDSNPGDCSEMINVKSENGILKIHKDKQIISGQIAYTRVITHDIQSTENYIGFDDIGVIWFDPISGEVLQRLYESVEDLGNIHVCTLNNMIIISDKNKVYNISYLFSNGSYVRFVDNTNLDINLPIRHELETVSEATYSDEITLTQAEKEQWIDLVHAAYNKYFEDNEKNVFGFYLVGVNITLWDNTETKLTNLQPFVPTDSPINNDDKYTVKTFPLMNPYISGDNNRRKINFTNLVKTHKVVIDEINLDQYKEYIKAINIYVSKPISPVIFNKENLNIQFNTGESTYKAVNIKDSSLDKQLLYKYRSYTIDDLKKGVEEYIAFGLDNLVTNKTLDVDSGLTVRAGQMKVYNNRIHYYDSVAKIDLTNASYIENLGYIDNNYLEADTYVFLRNTNGDIITNVGKTKLFYSEKLEPYYALLDYMTIIQDSRAYKIVFVAGNTYAEVSLSSSSSYNYAYSYLGKVYFSYGDKYKDIKASDVYPEQNAINVTSQNNPINFPVEHSYAFAGAVRDIAYATEPISQTQIGQYPLYVFTDEGIFTLEQGTGTVLYSNITMINTDHIAKGISACQTRNGVAYIANGSVYILSGRNNLNISLALKGHLDKDIQECPAYAACCQNSRLYDITARLSQVNIEKYLENAILSYSAPQDELYVSNRDYEYSYAFSFAYKNWSKVTDTYSSVSDNVMQKQLHVAEDIIEAKAKGSMLVNAALLYPSEQIYAYHSAIIETDLTKRYSGQYELTINEEYVGLQKVQNSLPKYMIIAKLFEHVSYLYENYDGINQTIYSSRELIENSNFRVTNVSTGEVIAQGSWTALNADIEIPAKGLGYITVKGVRDTADTTEIHENNTREFTESDTAYSIARDIAGLINTESYLYHADAVNVDNKVALTARVFGSQGNGIRFSCTTPHYIDISIEPMTGGIDPTTVTRIVSQLIDCTTEEDSDKIIHIQSCPISWENTYTLINRIVFNCKAKLGNEHNLSVYLFASNDLSNWQCVAASQKTDVNIDHIRLSRCARSWKHYIVIIGGQMSSLTELSSIMIDVTPKYNNKLR